MRNVIFFNLIITILLAACSVNITDMKKKKKFPMIVDTLGATKILRLDVERLTNRVTTANYLIYFIGKIKDTIFIQPYMDFTPKPLPLVRFHKPGKSPKIIPIETKMPFQEYHVNWPEKRDYKYADKSDIEILIDTTKIMYKSYPILLTNNSIDTIFIGYGERIPLILEAQDSNKVWRPIQRDYIYGCGNGIGSVFLPSNESVLTLGPIYNGNFKTQLRLTLGKNHSNTYTGFINYEQFQMDIGEIGNG